MPDLFRKFPRWRLGADTDNGAGVAVSESCVVAASGPSRTCSRITTTGDPVASSHEFWQAAPVAVALVAPDGLIECNPACRALLGHVVGDSPGRQRRWLEASVLRMLVSGLDTEVLSAGPDKSMSVEVRVSATGDIRDRRIVILREVVERGSGQDELAELASTLSHEFRTPLTSMKNSLNLILGGQTGPLNEDQIHFLGMTKRNIERLERLVADVLDMSRAGAAGPALRRRDVELGRVLREALVDHSLAASQKGLTCDVGGIPERFQAHVDPDKIIQIVDNIVGNALKYTPSGGMVRVWLEQRSSSRSSLAQVLAEQWFLPLHIFSLVVEDNGPGLSDTDLQRVFDPFFRAQDGTTDAVPGAGLGLHITRGLVEAHGGSIRLMSQPGQGTTAWIRIPRDRESERLLLAAARLETELRTRRSESGSARLAVLDLRRERLSQPAGALVRRFCREWLRGRDRTAAVPSISPAMDLAAGLVALVTDDTVHLNEAWSAHIADHPGADLPDHAVWQDVVVPEVGETGDAAADSANLVEPVRRTSPA